MSSDRGSLLVPTAITHARRQITRALTQEGRLGKMQERKKGGKTYETVQPPPHKASPLVSRQAFIYGRVEIMQPTIALRRLNEANRADRKFNYRMQ